MNCFPVAQLFLLLKMPSSQRKRSAYIYSVRVIAHMRGMGIGSRLLRYAEMVLVQSGYQWAVLSTAKDNQKARRLYERLGYEVYGEDAGQWSYENHRGEVIYINEPAWMLHKKL